MVDREEAVQRPEEKDQFFAEDMKVSDFKFDQKVASVFDDMVSRSVPLYHETQNTALQLGKNFVLPESNVYDIGASTGTLLMNFAEMVGDESVRYVGIDNAQPMVDRAKGKYAASGSEYDIDFVCGNIEDDLGMKDASVIFMTYTLQFIRPLQRQHVVEKLYSTLKTGGALILVEKVLGNNSLFNRMYIDLYYKYKASAGYSDKEIKQKREALENVLIPYRIDENTELLERSGFKSVDIFFKWFNWAGIVAVKD